MEHSQIPNPSVQAGQCHAGGDFCISVTIIISKQNVIKKHMTLENDHVQQCTVLHSLTSGPKAIILRTHSSVKRAVKTMFKYFSMDSYRSGAP